MEFRNHFLANVTRQNGSPLADITEICISCEIISNLALTVDRLAALFL